jgi:sugar lactone lactonase YvrE
MTLCAAVIAATALVLTVRAGLNSEPHTEVVPPATPAEPCLPFERDGAICVSNAAGKVVTLTTSGKNRSPKRSPDGRCVVFIRKSANQAYLSAGEEADYRGDDRLADQLWSIDTQSGKEKRLVEDRTPAVSDATKDLHRMIAHIADDSLCFSPDGKLLYFISSAWVTSGALHVVTLDTGRERFLAAANSVEVVASGTYGGHLIVRQHRYFLSAGSYDWYWLFDPKGREIGPVGETVEQVQVFKELNHSR